MEKILLNLTGFINKMSHANCGGGQISNFLLFDYLKRDYEVHVLTLDDNFESGSYSVDGLFYHNIKFHNIKNGWMLNDWRKLKCNYSILNDVARRIRPRIIIADRENIWHSVCYAKEHGIRSVIFIRAYENFFKDDFCFYETVNKRTKFFFDKLLYSKKNYIAVKTADIVISNSIFMRSMVSKCFSVDSKIVYPPIDISFYKKITRGVNTCKVGFLKPEYKKGLYIFLDIVKKMKDVKFLCFGMKPARYEKIIMMSPNIEFLGWKNDPQDIYSKINILLVPSIWPEPFGRVAVEASASSVLPIVADRGGLPEAVKPGACIISDIYDVDLWISRIKHFLSNNVSKIVLHDQQEYIKKFDVAIQANILNTTLREVIQ